MSDTVAWRLWPLARLLNPTVKFGFGKVIPGANPTEFFAHCPHGNQPPTPTCSCGLHYIHNDDRAAFFQSPNVMVGHAYGNKIVCSAGEPLGRVLPDAKSETKRERESWGGATAWRSTGFRIHGLIVTPNQARPNEVGARLRARYPVPVLVARWDTETAADRLLGSKLPTSVVAGRIINLPNPVGRPRKETA